MLIFQPTMPIFFFLNIIFSHDVSKKKAWYYYDMSRKNLYFVLTGVFKENIGEEDLKGNFRVFIDTCSMPIIGECAFWELETDDKSVIRYIFFGVIENFDEYYLKMINSINLSFKDKKLNHVIFKFSSINDYENKKNKLLKNIVIFKTFHENKVKFDIINNHPDLMNLKYKIDLGILKSEEIDDKYFGLLEDISDKKFLETKIYSQENYFLGIFFIYEDYGFCFVTYDDILNKIMQKIKNDKILYFNEVIENSYLKE